MMEILLQASSRREKLELTCHRCCSFNYISYFCAELIEPISTVTYQRTSPLVCQRASAAAGTVMLVLIILGFAVGAAAHNLCDAGYNRPSSNVSVLVLHTGQASNAIAQLQAMGVSGAVWELDASKTVVRSGGLSHYSAMLVGFDLQNTLATCCRAIGTQGAPLS